MIGATTLLQAKDTRQDVGCAVITCEVCVSPARRLGALEKAPRTAAFAWPAAAAARHASWQSAPERTKSSAKQLASAEKAMVASMAQTSQRQQ